LAGAPPPPPDQNALTTFLPPEIIATLLSRGEAVLVLGDVSAARLLFGRAAQAGSGKAALAMGRTYDPSFLRTINIRGLRPDAAEAATWYRRAIALGEGEAQARLALLQERSGG
jgi:TPR repeat protein